MDKSITDVFFAFTGIYIASMCRYRFLISKKKKNERDINKKASKFIKKLINLNSKAKAKAKTKAKAKSESESELATLYLEVDENGEKTNLLISHFLSLSEKDIIFISRDKVIKILRMKIHEMIGRKISEILRHDRKKDGLIIESDGYTMIDSFISLLKNKYKIIISKNELIAFVSTDSKQRYGLRNDELIRAHQGHTMTCVKLDCIARRINPHEMDYVYHGTTLRAWNIIKITGLDKMTRTAIHCAIGIPGDEKVKSGMRINSECIIQVDINDAIGDGINFHLSENDVVLCEGRIPAKYLKLYQKESDI